MAKPSRRRARDSSTESGSSSSNSIGEKKSNKNKRWRRMDKRQRCLENTVGDLVGAISSLVEQLHNTNSTMGPNRPNNTNPVIMPQTGKISQLALTKYVHAADNFYIFMNDGTFYNTYVCREISWLIRNETFRFRKYLTKEALVGWLVERLRYTVSGTELLEEQVTRYFNCIIMLF